MYDFDMETAEQVIENAIKGFKSTLDEKKLDRFPGATVEHVKRSITAIQADQERSKKMLNFNRIHCFLEAWEKFDDSCKALHTGLPELSGFIWGPLDWVLRVAKEDPKALDRILESYLALGQRLAPITQHGNRLAEHPPLRKCLAWMYHDLLMFHTHILKLFEPRGWSAIFEAQWKDYNDQSLFRSLLDSVEKNGQCISSALNSQAQYDTQRRLNDHVSRYGTGMSEILRHISEYEEDRQKLFDEAQKNETARKNEQFLALLGWFRSPMEPEKRRHEHCRSIRSEYPETGSWILNEEKVNYWMDQETPSHSMLWLQGAKGAGKTILTSIIIEHLIEHRHDAVTSYFYCRSGDEKSGESLYMAILKSLLRQILSQNRDLLAAIYDRRVKGRNGVEILGDEATAKSLLKLLCDTPARQFIVIDGLDEMKKRERKEAIDCLSSIIQKSDSYNPGRIRVLIVSTDLEDMRALAKSVDYLDVYDLDPKNSQMDIELYMKKRSRELQEKFRLGEDEVKRATDKISAKSKGMFLYAFLVSENLLEQPTQRKFSAELQSSLPENLEKAYDRIIERLRSENCSAWEEARKIFGWLICATRPLKSHELHAVLSMQVNEQGVIMHSYKDRLRTDIRAICGSLIRIIGNTIEFIHETAEMYVIRNENLDRRALESDVAFFCLGYLSQDCFSSTLDKGTMNDTVTTGLYAFQDYAVARWDSHLTNMIRMYANIFEDQVKGAEYQQKANVILQQFYWVYQSDLATLEDESTAAQGHAIAECQAVQNLDFYYCLVPIWTHILRHYEQGISKRYQVSLQSLSTTLDKTRQAIRTWGTNTSHPDIVDDYYGNNLFKCSRTTCAYFHEGFDSEDTLKHHNNRHERPFTCPLEAGCTLARFGFATNRDRDRHIRVYHPDTPGNDGTSTVNENGARKEGPKFQCDICGNRFTRNAILTAHMDSAHLGRRPYECSVCGKAFTRKNDRVRHEKNRHTRR